MRKLVTTILYLIAQISCFAQAPEGYYSSLTGLSGNDARLSLHNDIDDHTAINYDNIWGYFNNTDIVGGVVLDIYSITTYAFNVDQCSGALTADAEGDCYNREHSMPQSWFNSNPPMVSDLFHIYPSDGYVNNQRSSFPFGEVGSASYTSTNGSKKGNNSYPGYTGTAFEPAEEYKGDIARTYFYMATRYMDVMSSWSGDNIQGNTLNSWTVSMMVEWHESDPVSQKEVERNNAVYIIQGNRNPYIDSPGWVDRVFVWPTSINEAQLTEMKMWYSNKAIYFQGLTGGASPFLVYDSVGKLVKSDVLKSDVNSYSLNLSAGIYFASYQNYQLKLVVW
jgi:endonuclease I